MNEPKDPLLLDHEYDGIQELDNKLPRWWVWLFYLCTLFAVAYMFYFHVFHMGELSIAEYIREAKAGDALKNAAQEKFESSLASLEPSKDPAVLAKGQNTFMTYCAPCHRQDGGGLVGPNLCDDYWIHGPKFEDNLKTIVTGVPEKGMLTWKGVLQPSEIHAVASYIYTLRGTQPPNPKPREDTAPVQTESYE
ncbi:MAG TPA: cbb3-type cytochrome c oxidase N-terminal domain-containing protein [Candidatus Limnocylindria bacterium]|jgi:cytochrome c oxidase cbb3-type subunit 3|nr:cbb3-type cytochrome c oxidase N-terminal domain-containing protein [Candidatus Limnocylindria bacterium]